MFKDTYLQPNLPDTVWDNAFVLSLARRFAPSAEAVMRVDESGGEARTYFIDAAWVLKTQRPNRLRPRTSLAREAFFLRLLEKETELSVPRVLGHEKRDAEMEYTLLSRMLGDAIVRTAMTAEELSPVLHQHGKALRTLHSLPQEPFLASGLFPQDADADTVKARFRYRFEMAVQTLPEQATALSLADEIIHALPDRLTMVALHSNPYKEHTFVLPSKQYSGMIDFGDAYISHPVQDLRRWSFDERRALLAGYLAKGEPSADFLPAWNAQWQLDAIVDILRNEKTLVGLSSVADLLNR